MKIHVNDLTQPMSVQVTGTESWLDRIYGDFAVPGQESPRVRAHLEVAADPSTGAVRVTGRLDYEPLIPCSRCDLSIGWPVGADIDVWFMPEESGRDEGHDRTLSRADLDAYYLEDGNADIEQLFNDLIQTALPTQAIRVTADGRSCLVCHEDVSAARVFSTGKDDGDTASPSPFASLAGLKVRQ